MILTETEVIVLYVSSGLMPLIGFALGMWCGAGGMERLIDKLFFKDEKEGES